MAAPNTSPLFLPFRCVRFRFCQILGQLIQRRFERRNLGAGGGKVATGGGHLLLGLTGQLVEGLMKEFDIRLQAARSTLHLLLGGADFQSANVLCCRGRWQRRVDRRRKEQEPCHVWAIAFEMWNEFRVPC